MNHQMVQLRFAALTTAHLADACIRTQVPVRCASALLRAVAPGSRLAGHACPAQLIASNATGSLTTSRRSRLIGRSICPPGFHVLSRRWVGLAILCVSLASRRAPVAYGGLQVALWMISVSMGKPVLWLVDASHTHYGLNGAGPFFLVTLALSLILVALYKPVTHGLPRP